MTKANRKLTTSQKLARKEAKAERHKKYEWVFMDGKQVRVKRQPVIDGMPTDEFIQRNADPIFLHQNELYEVLEKNDDESKSIDDLPF